MNEFTIYKHQTNFEKELGRLRASALPPKTKKQIEDFAHIRLAKGSSKLRVVKCMWCVRYLAGCLKEDDLKNFICSELGREDIEIRSYEV